MVQRENVFALNIPRTNKPRVVIVGGGFGGLQVIKHLSEADYQVVVLDRYNYHTFQPLLYQVATAGLEPDSVAGPLRKILRKKRDIYFRMLKVNRIDTMRNFVQTSAGNLYFDYLILATGAQMNFFGNANIAKHAFPLKQVTHALDLRSHIFQQFENLEVMEDEADREKLMRFVIVGAGPTGVELCGALAELRSKILPSDFPEIDFSKMEIHLVEGLPKVLPAMSDQTSEKTKSYLEKMGIKIRLNTLTSDYDGETITFDNGETLRASTLIWAAGVKGNIPAGFHEDAIIKGKLRVNQYNQVYRRRAMDILYDNIFAIGDVSAMISDKNPKGLPGLAPVAIQQGKHLARNLNRKAGKNPFTPFQYKNKGALATVGRNKAVADLPNNKHLSGFAGWIVWMVVHLMYLVGFRNKAVVFTNWIWNYFTYDRGIRLILRPSTKKSDRISKEMKKEMHEASATHA